MAKAHEWPQPSPRGYWVGFGGKREKAAPGPEGARGWANHTIGARVRVSALQPLQPLES